MLRTVDRRFGEVDDVPIDMCSSDDQSVQNKGRRGISLDIGRGAVSALGFGVAGIIAISTLLSGMGYWVPKQVFIPSLGTAFILAGTGWATFAPRGNYSFAWTLAIIFIGPVGNLVSASKDS